MYINIGRTNNFQKYTFGYYWPKLDKSRCRNVVSMFPSNFAKFLYLVPDIMSKIV